MRVRIEKLRKRDLVSFYRLFKKAIFEDFKEYTPEVAEFQWRRHRKNCLLRQMKSGEETIFLAKDKDKKVVAILIAAKPLGGVANCDWLIVAPDFRGKGVGTGMLDFWQKWAKRAKCHLLTLTSDPRNLNFYQRMGYEQYGFMGKGYFNDNDYFLFKRIGQWDKNSLKSR